MKKKSSVTGALFAIVVMGVLAYNCASNNKPKETATESAVLTTVQNGAFLNHRDSVPSKQQYADSLFVLSHDYPTSVTPVEDPSWEQILNGQPISATNVFAYMDALKAYIAPRLLPFFHQ